MSILQWNCRGLNISSEHIRTLFRDYNTMILCLQETKLGDTSYNPGLNYNFHRSPPIIDERAQGGTAFIIHKSIRFSTIQLSTDLQACAVQVHFERKITLCSLYLDPKLEDHLFDGHRWGYIIEQLLDAKNDLVLLNDGSPTRYDIFHNTTSAIDLTISTASLRLEYNWAVDRDLHGIDLWPILLQYVKSIPSPCLPKWKIKEADWKEFAKSSAINELHTNFLSPVAAYAHFSQTITDSAQQTIPKNAGLPRCPVVPWWNKQCEVARKITRTCLQSNGTQVCDPKRVAEILGAHFASVSSAANYAPEFQIHRDSATVLPLPSNNTESFNLPFTFDEMKHALSSSALTSPGDDDIRYEMIVNLPQCSQLFLLTVYNDFWTTHSSPDTWDLQFGFRKNHSTLDPLLILSREIQNAFARRHQTIGVFFDLEKAYDTTWRGGILKQLASWGIGGHIAPTALEAGRKIQATINAVTKWADRRGFKFSPQKTKAIRFTRCRKREEIPTLFLKGVILLYESEVKFLGVIFDKGLTFVTHVNDLCIRVRQSTNILKVVSHYDWGADHTILLRLYKTLCLSKIDYACQIYGSAARTTLEKLDVHNLGLRICTGAYRTSPVDSLYVDSGVPPLSLCREELGLRYLAKCLTSKDNSNFKFVMNPYDISPNRPCIPKPLEVRLEKESREIGLYDSTVAKLGPTKYPPWCKPPVEICICTGGKQHHDPQAVKAQFLEHSSKHNTSISVYTDGSKSKQGVGSAAVFNGKIIKHKLPSAQISLQKPMQYSWQ
ncbi:uncharacterized protein LOC143035044 [Oratosquilla oratoria]|uniref:uncharacterized protein LOC143035044 n=1 Tax=Oratosquilla oratoria TaxID=337810 RepID=UPI003F7727C3